MPKIDVDINLETAPILVELFLIAKQMGVSNKGLSEATGLPPETISRVKGKRNVELRTVERLANAVGFELALRPIREPSASALMDSIQQGQFASLFDG